jgi:outer membrane receptor protein involved in Fe transport
MKFFLSIYSMMFAFTMFAQDGKLKGNVADLKNNDALIGVNISVQNNQSGTTTDIDGNYELELPAGKYTIIYTYVGYEEIKQEVNIIEAKETVVNIQLTESRSLLNEVVITTSKFARRVGEETVSIDIIKPAMLEKQNLTDAGDVVKRSPGVTVVDGQPNIRGGSGWSYGAGSRVLLLMDDLPMLQPEAGFVSWDQFPVENISQIEVIKGAASALYGSSAMNGIINIRTAYPTSEPYFKFSVFGGVIDNPNRNEVVGVVENKNFTGEIIKTKVNKNWWELDSITFKGVNSAAINTPDTTFVNDSRQRPHNYGFSWNYREKLTKSKKLDLIFGGQFSKQIGHNWGSTGTRGRFNVNVNYRINEKIQVGVNTNLYTAKSQTFFLWGGGGINKYIPGALTGFPTQSRSFRGTIDPYFRYADTKGNSHKILSRYMRTDVDNSNDQDNSSDYIYGEYQYQKNISKINFVITTGFTGNYTLSKSQLFGNTNHSLYNLAGYLQLDKKFWNKLNVVYGFRFETFRMDKDKAETKPVSRIGINVEAAKYTFIRASWGQGFRFPTVAEKYIETSLSDNLGIYPNPNLTSEKGMTAELGIKQGVKLGRDFNAYLDVAGFYQEYTNMMEFNVDIFSEGAGFSSVNIGNTRIFGTEVTLMGEGKLFNKFPTTLVAGYTFIKPMYKDYTSPQVSDFTEYNVLKYRFRHQLQSMWDISFGPFDFGASLQYFSAMENFDRILATVSPSILEFRYGKLKKNWESKKPQNQLKGDVVIDLRAGINFGKNKNYRFMFTVKNVTNREYTLRPSLVEAPRNYGFRFDMTFK